VKAVPEVLATTVSRDGAEFLPEGFFDFYPDLHDRQRFEPLLRQAGTPVFLADTRILIDRYRQLDDVLARSWGDSAIAYSF
jgi:hypothetical protein